MLSIAEAYGNRFDKQPVLFRDFVGMNGFPLHSIDLVYQTIKPCENHLSRSSFMSVVLECAIQEREDECNDDRCRWQSESVCTVPVYCLEHMAAFNYPEVILLGPRVGIIVIVGSKAIEKYR